MLLIFCWFCWGFSYPAAKFALRDFDVWTFRVLAMAPAGLIMLAYVKLRGGSIHVRPACRLPLVVAGLLNMAIFQIGITYGVDLLSSGRTAVIAYTMPLWAAIFAVWLLHERLTTARIVALLLGLVGLAVLMSQEFANLKNAPLGAGLTLMAAISFGAGTVWMKRFDWDADVTALGGWQLVAACVPLIAIQLVVSPPLDWASIGADSWAGAIYSMLFANMLAYAAWFRVVARFPATVSGLGSMAVPVIGVFASAALLDEAIGWRELAALGLVCTALAIVVFASQRPANGQ